MCVCVCVCVIERERECVCEREIDSGRERERERECVCVRERERGWVSPEIYIKLENIDDDIVLTSKSLACRNNHDICQRFWSQDQRSKTFIESFFVFRSVTYLDKK